MNQYAFSKQLSNKAFIFLKNSIIISTKLKKQKRASKHVLERIDHFDEQTFTAALQRLREIQSDLPSLQFEFESVMRGKSAEQLQTELRQEFEISYKERIRTMQGMYELRYQSLEDAIASVYDRIRKDELLPTMFNDRVTSMHIQDRVKEIFSEVVAEERELIFKKMGSQIASLKFENEEQARLIKRLKESTQSMQKNFYTERETIEQAKNNASQQLKRTRQENYNLKAQQKIREKDIQNLQRKVEEITEQNDEMRQLLMSLKQSKEEGTSRQQQIGGYKIRMAQMQEIIDELKNNLKENQDKFDRKYNNKKKEFKQKIEQYKTVILQLRSERVKTESTVKRMDEDALNTNAERKIASLIKDHERKLNQLKFNKDKQRSELQRKYEYKIKEMQSYFEKLLQSKISEIEENATTCYEKLRDEGTHLQQYIQQYEENYLPIAEHEEEVIKRDELIIIMKKKLGEFESKHEKYLKNEEQLLMKLRQNQSWVSDFKQKMAHNEEAMQQMMAKIKVYQQSNNIFKINEKKSKDQYEEYERLVKKHREDYDDVKRTCIRLEEEKSQIEVAMREKDRKIKDINQDVDLLQAKIRKANELTETTIKDKDNLSLALNETRKEVTNLEFKLRDQQLNSSLQVSSWENKLNNLQIQVKQKSSLLADLQAKYTEISNLYQEERKKNYDMENIVKKQQIENSFYKESDEIKKTQQRTAVDELRRLVSEKNSKIESLEQENQSKLRKIRTMQTEDKNNRQRIYQQNKILRSTITKMNKLFANRLENLRKEGRMIKEYLQSRQMIIKNDQQIFKSTLMKELIHLQIANREEREFSARKIKDDMTSLRNSQIKIIKDQFQDRMKNMADRHEVEKIGLKKEIKEKESIADELNRELKKNALEVKKEREDKRALQKELEALTAKLNKERQIYEFKLQQSIKEIKDERQSIIKEYSQKKSQMEQEIEQLMSTLRRLKQEIESIQQRHEEEKFTINSQLRTIKEQEQIVQKVVFQKDQQIQKYLRDLEHLSEAKRSLEHQVRGCMDTINKKIQQIHELELKENQLSGECNLIRNKCDRIAEQNSEMKRKMSQREEELEQSLKSKVRVQNELRDIKGALNRSNKNSQLRALSELSMQTMQLSQKVNEMRKVSSYLDGKTPLRS